MAALRNVSCLLNRRPLNMVSLRSFADQMILTFAAANKVFYDAKSVKQVDVPTVSGSFSILPKHVPTLANLTPGIVTVYENEGAVKEICVSSGSVTVNEDSSVQILAEEAIYVENLEGLDEEEITKQLSKATKEHVKAFSGKMKPRYG